jgi:hypothetical protein
VAAAETQNNRVERKLDELVKNVSEQSAELRELRQAIAFQARETAQVNELVKDKVGRVEKALDEEKVDRKAAILNLEGEIDAKVKVATDATAAVKATLGKIAMALFTALLSAIVAVALYVVTR